eukprot:1158958-Pelagomonas_calceolata.AAC.6
MLKRVLSASELSVSPAHNVHAVHKPTTGRLRRISSSSTVAGTCGATPPAKAKAQSRYVTCVSPLRSCAWYSSSMHEPLQRGASCLLCFKAMLG